MNRIIFSFIMCFVALTNPILAEDNLTIPDFLVVQGATGQEFSINLNNDQTYAAFQFDLYLPAGVTITSCSAGSRLPAKTDLQWQQQTDGSYRFIAVPPTSNSSFSGTSGAIITITVSASADVTIGSLTGYFRNIKLSDADGEGNTYAEMPIPIKIVKRGDVNDDGNVDAQDASLVLQFVAKKIDSIFGGNVNNDGGVDAQDASLILQYVAKKITW